MVINMRTAQIRLFRLKLNKIRNMIDYLLEHPYSLDNSFQTKAHSRDNSRGRKWRL